MLTPSKNPSTETEQPLELVQYLHVILRYKWFILLCMAIVVSLALLHNSKMVPVYKATGTIIIDREMPKVPISSQGFYYQSYLSELYTFNTHFKLIRSRVVLRDVVERLDLDKIDKRQEKEKFGELSVFKKYINQLKTNFRLLFNLDRTAELDADLDEDPGSDPSASPDRDPASSPPGEVRNRADAIAESLADMIEIEPVEETRLLNIHVSNTDPVLARDIANTLAQAYIDFNIKNRLKSTQNTLGWLTDQLYEMKKSLEDAEAEFLAYKQSVKLISVEDSQKMIAEKITNFNDAYLKARNRRLEVEAKLGQLERFKGSGGDVPHLRSLIDNPLIDSLYSQLLDAEIELSRMSEVYKSKHPKVIQARTSIGDIRKKIGQEIRKEVGNLKAERSVLIARERVLQKTIADFENEAMETNTKELQSTILERNVDTNQRLYDAILARLKEADLSGNIDVSNIRITEKALLPGGALDQGKRRNVLLAALIGLMIGAGLAFLWEYMDRSLRNEEDVEKSLGLPVLSVIPIGEQAKGGGYGKRLGKRSKKK
ncbi:MAG: GumC family protein [Deltaproteobacteria bacterium]|nr:GumC family protein [Deltaproteobacteria bacterium]